MGFPPSACCRGTMATDCILYGSKMSFSPGWLTTAMKRSNISALLASSPSQCSSALFARCQHSLIALYYYPSIRNNVWVGVPCHTPLPPQVSHALRNTQYDTSCIRIQINDGTTLWSRSNHCHLLSSVFCDVIYSGLHEKENVQRSEARRQAIQSIHITPNTLIQ